LFLVVGTGVIDCLERLVSEMAYSVSSGTLNTYNLGSTDLLIKPDVLYWSKSPVDNSGRE